MDPEQCLNPRPNGRVPGNNKKTGFRKVLEGSVSRVSSDTRLTFRVPVAALFITLLFLLNIK